MKEQLAKITKNPVGLLVGAGAGFLIATKGIKTEKLWVKIAASVVCGVAGALVQAKMKAKAGVPTAATVASAGKK